ncbi:hypothetical protein L6452_13585 [Arctium lappa]|uniref:Uncharacterized protein n=1 Tax=Arctium lappa TaxID=4217 RepID=A0ACB9CIL8_ARCLA|nr:hypothetical protein L6452_13585 [Arctium lappa]
MAGLRSGGRRLSFEVLTTAASFFDDDGPFIQRSTSGPPIHTNEDASTTKTKRKKRRNKGSKKKNKAEDELNLNCNNATSGTNYSRLETMPTEVVYGEVDVPPDEEIVRTVISSERGTSELTQRSSDVAGGGDNLSQVFIYEDVKECIGSSCVSTAATSTEMVSEMNLNRNWHGVRKRKEESLEFKQVIAKAKPNHKSSMETLPVKYFMEDMYGGSSLRTTTSLADEKERERVYDTIFSMPWRCELLIDVGFFVCLDSFLSVLTIMPMRILTTSWRFLKTRQFKITSAAELSDLGCCLIMACGVILLKQTDFRFLNLGSLVIICNTCLWVRWKGNRSHRLRHLQWLADSECVIVSIFDRLCQNFGGDVLQTLFNSAHGLANCSPECRRYWLWRFISDEALAVVSSNILILQSIYLVSVCSVPGHSDDVSLSKSRNCGLVRGDVIEKSTYIQMGKNQNLLRSETNSIERFHISAFLVFILAQNILEAEGAWFENFLYNALVVHMCEMMVDIVKHSFIAKFNEVKPIVYSEFLEDLCKQVDVANSRPTLNIETGNGKKNLTFVPLAPACVSVKSNLCCSSSHWSDPMETSLDIHLDGDDICDAYKLQSYDRYGSS